MSRCSSCGRPITWAMTRYGWRPFDELPVPVLGRYAIADNDRHEPTARIITSSEYKRLLDELPTPAARARGLLLFRRHDETCPDAAAHRAA